jgi:hypothetical protein
MPQNGAILSCAGSQAVYRPILDFTISRAILNPWAEIKIPISSKILHFRINGEEWQWSIRAMTWNLRNGDLPEDFDVWSVWTYKGETLRSIYYDREKANE